MIRVAVVGAGGRMGTVVCEALEADADCELVARVGSTDSLELALDAGADVAVEFTTPDTVKRNTAWLLRRGIHTVVGATGLSEDDLAELEALTGPANCFVAPNFAIGAVLMMQFAGAAARHLPDAEIIELHHAAKVDAPSGTALRTAQLIDRARDGDHKSDPSSGAGLPEMASGAGRAGMASGAGLAGEQPSRGDLTTGVPIHSVRLPGLVAHQEVLLGAQGQTLSIRHDTTDRSAFMPGVLLAIKRIETLPGLTVGLEALL